MILPFLETARSHLHRLHAEKQIGHYGSSLSCLELVSLCFTRWLKPSDAFVLSKGHAASAVYSVAYAQGLITAEQFGSFHENGSLLGPHISGRVLPMVKFGTGSLGHGPGLAGGIAKGKLLRGDRSQVLCLLSDGELNEGSVWEAALFARHQRLSNLTWLIDRNQWQGFGRTEEVLALEPLVEKFKSFGFLVVTADGHQPEELEQAYESLGRSDEEFPRVLIARTIKGQGWAEYEDRLESHYLPPQQGLGTKR